MTSRRRILLASVAVLAALAGIAAYYFHQLVLIGSAYTAKTLCSGVFISRRDAISVLKEDVRAEQIALLRAIEPTVNSERRIVSASFNGLAERTAVYLDGLGCTLAIGADEDTLRRRAAQAAPVPPAGVSRQQLLAGEDAKETDREKLKRVLDRAFSEPDAARLRRTRAVVIVHDGRIVAERYAQGYGENTTLLGWSMTKSALNALIGVLVAQGRLRLDATGVLRAWSGAGDARGAITLGQLLHMESGLEFTEEYVNPLGDVTWMLFGTGDAAALAAAKPLAATPGTHWSYSSGTSNILARVLREAIADDAEYLAFPRRALFERIGMAGAVIEADAAGNFVASSFMHATARDWARLGLLYLQDGVWGGERILPEGWVKYSVTPAPASGGRFGAHFWLKLAGQSPGLLPPGAYHMAGHDGQFVTIVPEKKLVVVRLGLSRLPRAWNQTAFVAEVIATIRD
jgi:CubicO group peptidase (beta-lactamase class C family)